MEALKKAQKDGVVLGLKGFGSSEQRYDIDVLLAKYPDTFNLYILALEALQDVKNKDKMGYFEVAGIHGLPQRAWDNVNPDGRAGGSYCPHGSLFFPTWHRPYLALLEQTIYAQMLEIAGKFKDTKRWTDAAKHFRLPYWDYYRPRGGRSSFPGGTASYDFSVPKTLTEPNIMLFRPGATADEEKIRKRTKNPLYSYEFPQDNFMKQQWDLFDRRLIAAGERRLSSRVQTTRHPNASLSNTSDTKAMNDLVEMNRASGVESLLNMIEWPSYNTYVVFSNTNQRDENQANGSLEGLHNNYHGILGGNGGHMGRVATSSFDPVFWLHHCNIDRIFAIWQATHDSWITSRTDATRPLYPFRLTPAGSNTRYWNSNDSRNVEDFGYTYPDTAGLKDKTAIISRFDRNYRWSLHTTLRRNVPDYPTTEMEPIDVLKTEFFNFNPMPEPTPKPEPISTAPSDRIQPQPLPPGLQAQAPLLGVSGSRSKGVVVQTAAIVTSSSVQAAVAAQPILSTKNATQQETVVTNPAVPTPLPENLGLFGKSDAELLADKPEGTRLMRQWFIDSSALRTAQNGSFTIYHFFGPIPNEPSAFTSAPNLAALTHIFVAATETCLNCALQAQEESKAYTTSPVTSKLLDFVENESVPGLQSLHPRDVVAWLRGNLGWRVVGAELIPIEPADVRLKVMVSSTISFVYPGETVPVFVEGRYFPEVTGVDINA